MRLLGSALLTKQIVAITALFAIQADSSTARTAEPGVRTFRDVSYGADRAQRFDVYAPRQTRGAPVIFMVHGGGWTRGDKRSSGVAENKVARWVPRGFIVISTNYRMVPKADPVEQMRDVARALAAAQQKAATWGGDPAKFILMGHSAGAHLVALLAASPDVAARLGVRPWLGAISLESGALDVPWIMNHRHLRLYDRAFGGDSAFWRAASPIHALARATAPMLVVCSTRRAESCPTSDRFVAKAVSSGTRASVLRQNISHAQADHDLGLPGAYTDSVEAFMKTLDPAVASALTPAPTR